LEFFELTLDDIEFGQDINVVSVESHFECKDAVKLLLNLLELGGLAVLFLGLIHYVSHFFIVRIYAMLLQILKCEILMESWNLELLENDHPMSFFETIFL
jgi:hypothetical protein